MNATTNREWAETDIIVRYKNQAGDCVELHDDGVVYVLAPLGTDRYLLIDAIAS